MLIVEMVDPYMKDMVGLGGHLRNFRVVCVV